MDVVLKTVVGNTLKAMRQKPLIRAHAYDTEYDVSYLNTSVDIPQLIQGLQRTACGNLCFYGAPGTGKTALAAHIAEELGKPLLSKRASDILGMYVGQSEKNIAAMFEQAKREDAVLLLDEADSLLRDRRGAQQSWQVSQVNEMLVQMENFDGLFICSTNLMDNLDQASLRRFAMKVRFDYLNAEQACRMLVRESVNNVSPQQQREIAYMTQLAPGDFSAVKKRLNMLGMEASAEVLIQELKKEIEVKQEDMSNPIGFRSVNN